MSLSQAELVARRSGLGASDAAAALGLSPWQTPYGLWREKLGLVTDEEREENDVDLPMEVGAMVEPLVIRLLERKKKITISRRQEKFQCPIYPWRWTTVDGIGSDGSMVEAKSAGFIGVQWGKDETDEFPLYYHYQVQHGLAVTGLEFAWVPAIIGNTQFRTYRVDRNDELIAMLNEKEAGFWWNVVNNEPPPATTRDDMKLLYPKDNGKKIVITEPVLKALTDYKSAKDLVKTTEAVIDKLYIEITDHIGDNTILTDAQGNELATWKHQSTSRLDGDRLERDYPKIHAEYQKSTDSRVLRLKKPKKGK